MSLVEFRGVEYRGVLKNIDLHIEEGETLVLLGRSGSGKTTALKMVNALLYPSQGAVWVEGRATTDWDPIRLRRRIGYVIQEVGLFPHMTVAANIATVPRLEGWPLERIATRVDELLSKVGLNPQTFRDRRPRALSGGERQRVGIARALAADPPLLLFDEPFGALDPVTRMELQNQFLTLRQELGKTSIFVTHDVREAIKLASKIALLHQGQLEVVASPETFLKSTTPESKAFIAAM